MGDGLGGRTDENRTLLVEPARRRRKALRRQHLAHRGSAERRSLLLERTTDVVDRVVALAQGDDLLLSRAFLGLITRTRTRRGEEFRQLAAPKGVAQHPEGARRVAEARGGMRRREPLHIEPPHTFVLPLARGFRPLA